MDSDVYVLLQQRRDAARAGGNTAKKTGMGVRSVKGGRLDGSSEEENVDSGNTGGGEGTSQMPRHTKRTAAGGPVWLTPRVFVTISGELLSFAMVAAWVAAAILAKCALSAYQAGNVNLAALYGASILLFPVCHIVETRGRLTDISALIWEHTAKTACWFLLLHHSRRHFIQTIDAFPTDIQEPGRPDGSDGTGWADANSASAASAASKNIDQLIGMVAVWGSLRLLILSGIGAGLGDDHDGDSPSSPSTSPSSPSSSPLSSSQSAPPPSAPSSTTLMSVCSSLCLAAATTYATLPHGEVAIIDATRWGPNAILAYTFLTLAAAYALTKSLAVQHVERLFLHTACVEMVVEARAAAESTRLIERSQRRMGGALEGVERPLQVFSDNLNTLQHRVVGGMLGVDHTTRKAVDRLVVDMGDAVDSMATVLNNVLDLDWYQTMDGNISLPLVPRTAIAPSTASTSLSVVSTVITSSTTPIHPPTTTTAPSFSSSSSSSSYQGRILIVDDIATIRAALSALFKSYGLQTDVADSGEKAIDMIREGGKREQSGGGGGSSVSPYYAFVLLDNEMPGGISGPETASQIMAMNNENTTGITINNGNTSGDTITYGLTGLVGAADCIEFYDAGAVAVFAKPLRPHHVKMLLDAHCSGQMQRRWDGDDGDDGNDGDQINPTYPETALGALGALGRAGQGRLGGLDAQAYPQGRERRGGAGARECSKGRLQDRSPPTTLLSLLPSEDLAEINCPRFRRVILVVDDLAVAQR